MMFKFARTLFAAAFLLGAIGSAAQAATVAFQINSAASGATISNCRNSLGFVSDCDAVVNRAPSLDGNPTINVTMGGTTTFDFLRFTPGQLDPFLPDTFDITATLSFLSPAASFTGTGGGSGFTTGAGFSPPFTFFGRFTNGVVQWTSIASQSLPVGLVTVAFVDTPAGVFGDGETGPRSVLTQASISVVPLPAGVLLLGTALLGLFGLSRCRKPALA